MKKKKRRWNTLKTYILYLSPTDGLRWHCLRDENIPTITTPTSPSPLHYHHHHHPHNIKKKTKK